MKKTMIAFAMIVSAYSTTFSATEWHTYLEEGGGGWEWKQDETDTGCRGCGTDCEVTIVFMTSIGITPSGGGYILSGAVTGIPYKYLANGAWVSTTQSTSNSHIPERCFVVIDNSTDYPQLNGRVIDVGGLATNANSIFAKFFY